MSSETRGLYEFGDFRLDAGRRVVTRLDQPIRLNSKAFETLLVLVRNRPRIVGKDELMQSLWPDTFVEEVNLAQNISAVRKALGETPGENRYIATIPGKGYRFVCEAREIAPPPELVRQAPSMAPEESQAASGTGNGRDNGAANGTGDGAGRAARDGAANEPGDASGSPAMPARFAPSRRMLWAALVLASVFVLAGVVVWLVHRLRGGAANAPHSIAVLPFQPLGAGSDDDHLGLGMADGIIARLSNIRQLPVRTTDVVIRYNDPAADPLKAAREMGVDTVLTGRLQKSGDRIRVTVQLVRVQDGRALWAKTFDEKYTGVFQVEDAISEDVAQALALNLARSEKVQLQRHYTDNIDAYRNYLMGRYEEFTFTRDGMNRAIEYFNRAISDDPGYALAYAGLADAWTTESDWLISPREALPKADAAARKALAFDDQLAEAHGALAHALLHEWKLDESNREFHTALVLNPSNVSTYFAYSEYLASVGEIDQAIAEMNKALTIDPLSPEINSFLAWDYYLKRDYGDCLVSALRSIQMFPGFWLPHMTAGMCYWLGTEYGDGIREFGKALNMNPDSTFSQAGIAMCLAKAGRREEALHALEQLQGMQTRTYVSPSYVSLVYLALGERRRSTRGWRRLTMTGPSGYCGCLSTPPTMANEMTRDSRRWCGRSGFDGIIQQIANAKPSAM